MIKALLLSSLALNIGLLLGRLSGMLREAFVALAYGATGEADIVVLMLTVPDLLVNILMGGAFGAVLIPEFSQQQDKARQLLYQSMLFFGFVFVGITAAIYWQMDVLASLLVPGFTQIQLDNAVTALGWVIWLIPLTILAGVTTAYLHAQNKFMVAGLGTLIINSTIIAGLAGIYYGDGTLRLLALFVLLGGFLRLVSQLLPVKPSWNPVSSLQKIHINKALVIRYTQAMLSGSVLLLLPVVARALASFEAEGSVSLFTYATRLVEFPLAIAVTFLAAVFFPRISRSFTEDPVQHRQLIRYGVQMTLALALVAAITLVILSGPYSRIVYGYGNMQESSLVVLSTLVAIGLASLPFQGLSVFMTAVFNARKDTRTPLLISTSGLIFFLVSGYFGLFGHGLPALMWGILSTYGLICLLQLLCLKIDDLSWGKILFDREFVFGILIALILSGSVVHWLGGQGLPVWLTLLLACFSALVSLFAMALCNKKLRFGLVTRLNAE